MGKLTFRTIAGIPRRILVPSVGTLFQAYPAAMVAGTKILLISSRKILKSKKITNTLSVNTDTFRGVEYCDDWRNDVRGKYMSNMLYNMKGSIYNTND